MSRESVFPKMAGLFLVLAGCLLLVESPLLLLAGGWGGADGGPVWGGIAVVFGVPWLVFVLFAAAVTALVRSDRVRAACLAALVPALLQFWIAFHLWPHQTL